jgi:hypothetical protein
MVEIYHEGKTPGSVLCGLVYAHGCALLVLICVYDAKKNPGGRTGYPENHWDSFFVSESAYFVSLMFCVLDNNIRNFKCVLSGADFTAQEKQLSLLLGVNQIWGRIFQPGAG